MIHFLSRLHPAFAIRLLLVCIMMVTGDYLTAQTPAYMHFGVRDGLPSNLVYCGLQDAEGYVWFGTDKGLACFDGTRFHVYGMNEGLPDPEVLTLKLDSKGRLWIGCFNQTPCYMFHGKIVTAAQDTLLGKVKFNSGRCEFSEDEQGNIWFSDMTRKCFFMNDRMVERFELTSSISRFVTINHKLFALCSAGIYTFGSNDTLVSQLNFNDFLIRKIPVFDGIRALNNKVLASTLGNLILTQWDGTNFKVKGTATGPLGFVFTDREDNFWICARKGGAYRLKATMESLKNPEIFLPHETVNAFLQDKDNNFWFMTADNGVFLLHENAPVKFTTADGLPSNNIKSLARANNGQIIAGDDLGNLDFIGTKVENTVSLTPGNEQNIVRQVIPGARDTIWACTNRGIYLNAGTVITKIPYRYPTKTIALKQGELWFGTAGQIGRLKKGTWDTISLDRFRYVFIQKDGHDKIWGGRISGLVSENDRFSYDWGSKFPKLSARIVNIQPAGPDDLWVATPQDGLLYLHLQNETITRVDQILDNHRKPFQNIQSLFVDPQNPEQVWIATNFGVYGLDKKGGLLHFDTYTGLADNDVNAIYGTNDTLWVGTVLGLTRIVLRQTNKHRDYSTRITGLQYGLKDELRTHNFINDRVLQRSLELPAQAFNVQLDLAGLDYRSQGNIRFKCKRTEKLLPWMYWTPGNLLVLLRSGFQGKVDSFEVNSGSLNFGYKLPAGKYKLDFFAVNAGGVQSNLPDEITLIMPPVWYETIWFWLGSWGIILYAAWRFYRSRIAFRELNAAASELQLQALQSQMNPHFVGNSINAIQQFFYPPDPSKASEYIALFTRLLRETMHFSEYTFIRFEQEIVYDQDYLKMVHLRFGDRFEYTVTGIDQIPADTPFPAMILQPLLENATIHGLKEEDVSKLDLNFAMVDGKVQVLLRDNGVGILETMRRKKIANSDRKSKGLELLSKKVQTINRMYGIDLEIKTADLNEFDHRINGTQVFITYKPGLLNR